MKRRSTWQDAPNERDMTTTRLLRPRFSTGQLVHEGHGGLALGNHLTPVREVDNDDRPPYIHCMYSGEGTPTQSVPPSGRPLRRVASTAANLGRLRGEPFRTVAAGRLADARDLFDKFGVPRPPG